MKRGSGVLLNVSSLPSEFGIGDFSENADYFLSLIRDMGFSWWQILPLNEPGLGNSPYSSCSAFALNYLYVDPIQLEKCGLIEKCDIEHIKYRGEPYKVDYEYAKVCKKDILKWAYSKLPFDIQLEMDNYLIKQRFWLNDYAIYKVIKDMNGQKAWYEWEDKYKFRKNIVDKEFIKEYHNEYYFYVFEQYILDMQWARVRRQAANLRIGIIGDMPIYVSKDSVDVWANSDLFQLDKDLNPTKVAGVPPDYFAEDGQLWGNPLYNYELMAKDGFDWFMMRFQRNFELVDALRLDHFRGFVSYWAVDANSTTAKNGEWIEGPQNKIFSRVKKKYANKLIIAEDLGIIDDEVRKYVDKTGYMCMRVMQFGFDGDDSLHLPHNYPINCIAYTATHDNNTTLGWLYELEEYERSNALKYCGFEGFGWGAGGGDCVSTKAFIKTLFASSAKIAIVPLQDLCGYGGDTRMNIPGVAEGNWTYRATYSAFSEINRDYILELNNMYKRTDGYVEEC